MRSRQRGKNANLIRAHRFDLDRSGDVLANAGHGLGRSRKHEAEIFAVNRIGRDAPARARPVRRRDQLHMQCDRLGRAVHGEIARDIGTGGGRLFNTAAAKRNLRKLCRIEKIGAQQMCVPFLDLRVDAPDFNRDVHRRLLRLFRIYFNRAAEFVKFAARGSEKMMHAEGNAGVRGIDLVSIGARDKRRDRQEKNQ